MDGAARNIEFAKRAYGAMMAGDIAWMVEHTDPAVVFVQGGSFPTAGRFEGRDAMFGHYQEFMALVGGQFKLDAHDFLGSDERTAVYLTVTIGTGDDRIEFEEVHLWRIGDDRLLELQAVPFDPYSVDAWFEKRAVVAG